MRWILLIVGLVALTAFGQEKPASQPVKITAFAVTEEGQQVKLLEDGTWVPITEARQ